MSKPIGPICNLDCEYCYYLHKEELYPKGESWRMPGETLEQYIRQYIEAQPAKAPEVTFAWQGGEPTLLGVKFFERIVELQTQHARPGQKIVNTLQTNGVLLDDGWCEFFKSNEFLVGLSIDGPAEFHDRYRYDKQGNPTFDAVMRGLKLLQKFQVEYNVLVVVNRHNGDHGRRVYTYLRDNGVEFVQFIPIVERRAQNPAAADSAESSQSIEAMVSSRSILPEQFGRFLIDVFEEWVKRDVGRVFVQIFDQALSAWCGVEPSLCIFRRECGRALAIEHNGDLYSCDHFVEPDYRLGNILELPIVELANSERQQQFGKDKHETLPQYCRDCEVQFACNGECPKNRFIQAPDGESGLNYLCGGYRMFFNHINPVMKRMATEVKSGQPAATVMMQLRAESKPPSRTAPPTSPGSSPGRNELCPCGSGRKFKKCCLRG
ncbi:UNVERIFIED_CONTAM: hypothetical protein GTU68_052631 [Idotea baltica]|nr:hypothetical protein [Idotea baltica]